MVIAVNLVIVIDKVVERIAGGGLGGDELLRRNAKFGVIGLNLLAHAATALYVAEVGCRDDFDGVTWRKK